VDSERVSSTKKSMDESVKDQGDVGCFLIGRALSIMNLYHMVRCKQTVVPGSFSAFEGCCVQEGA